MIDFKNLKLDIDKKICYVDDKEILLTKTEYNMLLFFLSNKNKIFNRREIANSIWETNISFRSVDTIVSRLRRKLNGIHKNITTRIGFGYGLLE